MTAPKTDMGTKEPKAASTIADAGIKDLVGTKEPKAASTQAEAVALEKAEKASKEKKHEANAAAGSGPELVALVTIQMGKKTAPIPPTRIFRCSDVKERNRLLRLGACRLRDDKPAKVKKIEPQ